MKFHIFSFGFASLLQVAAFTQAGTATVPARGALQSQPFPHQTSDKKQPPATRPGARLPRAVGTKGIPTDVEDGSKQFSVQDVYRPQPVFVQTGVQPEAKPPVTPRRTYADVVKYGAAKNQPPTETQAPSTNKAPSAVPKRSYADVVKYGTSKVPLPSPTAIAPKEALVTKKDIPVPKRTYADVVKYGSSKAPSPSKPSTVASPAYEVPKETSVAVASKPKRTYAEVAKYGVAAPSSAKPARIASKRVATPKRRTKEAVVVEADREGEYRLAKKSRGGRRQQD